MSSSSIWHINSTLSGTTTPGQSGPESNDNEGVLRISQGPGVSGSSPSDCLMSYTGHSLARSSYSFAEMQWVYSTAPAYWVRTFWVSFIHDLFTSIRTKGIQTYLNRNSNTVCRFQFTCCKWLGQFFTSIHSVITIHLNDVKG